MRLTDGMRRLVIKEVQLEPVLWNIIHPHADSYGARSYAWQTIAFKLHIQGDAVDLRRMWRGWLQSYVSYRLREKNRKPKYYNEMGFLHALSSDHLLSLKYRF